MGRQRRSSADTRNTQAVAQSISLPADSRSRTIFELSLDGVTGEGDISLHASAASYHDSVTRPLRIVPRGFPVEVGRGALVEANGQAVPAESFDQGDGQPGYTSVQQCIKLQGCDKLIRIYNPLTRGSSFHSIVEIFTDVHMGEQVRMLEDHANFTFFRRHVDSPAVVKQGSLIESHRT